MLKTRVLTALVVLPLFLGALFWLPPLGWEALLAAIVMVAAHEWGVLTRLGRRHRLVFVSGLLFLVLALLLAPRTGESGDFVGAFAVLCMGAIVFWVIIAPLWLVSRWRPQRPLLFVLLGWIILTSTWLALVELRNRSPWLLLGFLLIIWIADTAAYFTGRRFGQHKLAPMISPGKTWEGVVGGLVAVTIYASVVLMLAPRWGYIAELEITVALIWIFFAMALTGLSIVGDLFESLLKRARGVKDSGQLLPGHGGVLDRIDSLTSTMPAAALFAHYWIR